MAKKDISIHVPVLTRVEGEGALELDIQNNNITRLKLNIFEPPRFFEKLLEGRHYSEVPDIVARICGICPVAYQVSAVQAFETLFGMPENQWISNLRRLFYCGEWIESHALHIHLLAMPDFMGYQNAVEMAQDHPEAVKTGMQLQKIGNEILKLIGGRSVHPIGIKVGGFHKAPDKASVDKLLEQVEEVIPLAEQLLVRVCRLNLPKVESEFTSVALRDPAIYAINTGRLASDKGHNLSIDNFSQHFHEFQVEHSTALHCALDGDPYLVGPLARLNLNFDRLPKDIEVAVLATGISFPNNNMNNSIIARAIEILYALHEVVELLQSYSLPNHSLIDLKPKAGIAYGCSEAPRGILWHRYEVDEEGIIRKARIVPPTSQNQNRMEQDLKESILDVGLERDEGSISLQAEQIIRNYDPCISCATHFLNLTINR